MYSLHKAIDIWYKYWFQEFDRGMFEELSRLYSFEDYHYSLNIVDDIECTEDHWYIEKQLHQHIQKNM